MKEFYLYKPSAVDVYNHDGISDIIMRENINQETTIVSEDTHVAEQVWSCDERQIRIYEIVSTADVMDNFMYYWEMADVGSKPLERRVHALEIDNAETREAINMILERRIT